MKFTSGVLADGGVGDDEMAMYLCTLVSQSRPHHVVLPFMHVEELFPYDGHFVIPFICNTHWGLLVTETTSEGLWEFVVITDLRTIFDEVKHHFFSGTYGPCPPNLAFLCLYA